MNSRTYAQPKKAPAFSVLPVRKPALRQRSLSPAEGQEHAGFNFGSIPLFSTNENPMQTKLTIGKPGDRYEQEADRTAEKVMSMPEPDVQRKCAECKEEEKLQRQPEEDEEEESVQAMELRRQPELEDEEEETLQSKEIRRQSEKEEEEETIQSKELWRQPEQEEDEEISPMTNVISRETDEDEDEETVSPKSLSGGTPQVTPELQNSINSMKGSGQPLPDSTRAFFEPRFNRDFSSVRLHTDSRAVETAKSINARAFTVGRDIAFGASQYSPETSSGKRLLAHELTHTVQQDKGRTNNPNLGGIPVHTNGVFPNVVMRSKRTFSLTFDDGPNVLPLGKGTNRTEKVLDVLKAKGIQAGFFIQTGVSFRGASDVGRALVKRMHKEGHKVGIHTGGSDKFEHEAHTKSHKAGRLKSELKAAKSYIKKHTGKPPKLVRPPYGKYSKKVTKIYKTLSLTNLLWDIDGDQGKSLGLSTLKNRIGEGITRIRNNKWKVTTPSSPKIVVLHHDVQKGTADNVGAIIDHIKWTTEKVSKNKDTADFAAP